MKTYIHTLPNNLKVILIDTKAFPSCTSLLLVGAGSRYEDKDNNGVAHFFEHMAFKGSKKYPNAFLLSSIIEGLGGEFNAFTSKDYTGYYVKSPVQYVETVLDVLSDMILNPLLNKDEIEKEKGVIAQEISMYEDTPQRTVFRLYENLLYKKNPLGMDVLGTKKTVESFTKKTFVDYIDSLYYPNNSVLILAGGLSFLDKKLNDEAYMKLIKTKFGIWKQGETHDFTKVTDEQDKPEVLIQYKKSEQAHLCFGYRTFKETDEDKYALAVLASILGSGMSSRLFTEVREKRGLCYSVTSYAEHYHDVGNMLTYAGVSTDQKKVLEAIKVIRDQHEDLTTTLVKKSELDRAKELIKGRLILSLEDTFNIAYLYGREMLHLKKHTSVREIMESIDAITAKDIKRVAQRVITPVSNLALVGPFKDKEPFMQLLS